ncbi:MAG: hypothetical protein JW963_05740, partial [Anaerolineales bacterium]|nr:hypothetical protein [Anaerolineales bacterium]
EAVCHRLTNLRPFSEKSRLDYYCATNLMIIWIGLWYNKFSKWSAGLRIQTLPKCIKKLNMASSPA